MLVYDMKILCINTPLDCFAHAVHMLQTSELS